MKSSIKNLGLALALCTVANNLYAVTYYEMDPAVYNTSISGNNELDARAVGTNNNYKAINRVSNWERSDIPCKFRAKMRHLNDFKESMSTSELISRCDGDKITAGFSDKNTWINALQICHSSNTDRIKGLRVWGAKLNRTTGALKEVGKDQDDRPNCSKWMKKLSCPVGELATKIVLEHTAAGAFTGVSLRCRQIVPQ